MASITISKLVKRYDNGFTAVRGIDLNIPDTRFMVLVGPSGCGKTTTLRMIAGLEDIASGTIHIGNRLINNVEPKDRDIAMVFQNYALYPHMTVYENMAYGLQLRRVPKDEIRKKVDAAAAMLSLQAQLTKLPKQLSGGQRQRVALGRAIVRQPSVFLFDEPLSNLDAKLRGEMRYELRTLQQRLQTTMVYVTHDQIEAMTLGDRITVMNAGEIMQVAPPNIIYDQPYNRFVAAFIGTPPMNFLAGTVNAGPVFTLTNGQSVALHMDGRENLGTHQGKAAVLGLRPEHLFPADEPGIPANAPIISMHVRLAELMGDHQVVYLTLDGHPDAVTMKCSPRVRAVPNSTLNIALDTRLGHVFANGDDTAANLTLPTNFPRQQ